MVIYNIKPEMVTFCIISLSWKSIKYNEYFFTYMLTIELYYISKLILMFQ